MYADDLGLCLYGVCVCVCVCVSVSVCVCADTPFAGSADTL